MECQYDINSTKVTVVIDSISSTERWLEKAS